MSTAFDHKLVQIPEDQLQDLAAREAQWQSAYPGDPYHPAGCRKKGCKETASHFFTYRYVTGRQGRTTIAERQMCQAHANEALAAATRPKAERIRRVPAAPEEDRCQGIIRGSSDRPVVQCGRRRQPNDPEYCLQHRLQARRREERLANRPTPWWKRIDQPQPPQESQS